MAILIGVHPGGRSSFAVAALYWSGQLPAMLIESRSHSSVQEVLENIIGVIGEWGDLEAAAIAAPLTWSPHSSGWRECDMALKKRLPKWAPTSWLRSPNALPGAVAVQGPALTWAMAYEVKRGLLPEHAVMETHPRASLAAVAPDLKTALVGYRKRDATAGTRQKHIDALLERFVDSGIVQLENVRPTSPDELDAVVCAVTALARAFPDCGLLTEEMPGASIRPVGRRSLVVLTALP